MSRSTENNLHAASANSAAAVADASAGYFAHPAGEGLNPVQGGVVCPPGYKQTEVGMIPEDWELKCLGEICNFENGDRSSNYPSAHEFSSSGIPFINAGHVSDGKIDLADMDYIPTYVYERLGGGKVKSGDLVYCLRGSLGKFGVVSDEFGLGAVASSLVIVRPKKSTTTNFVSAYFKSDLAKNMISLWAGGAAQPNLGAKELANFLVALPDSQEQTAIANALSDVDALISELEKLIAKKQAIKTATMQQLLTGRTRLPQFALREDGTQKGTKPSELGEIPEDWEVVALGDIGHTIIGLTYSPNDVAEFGTLVLRSSNVQNGKLAYDDNVFVSMQLPERVIVKQGDILVCVRNGSRQLIGKCALIDENADGSAFGAFMSIFRTKYSVFVFYQFQSDLIQNQINEIMGATINQITNKDMSGFKITLPSDEKEQTAIATILSDMDEELQALEQRLGKTRQIKQGMMQELLTGRIRLIKPSKEVIHE